MSQRVSMWQLQRLFFLINTISLLKRDEGRIFLKITNLKWETLLSYLRRSTAWSMWVIFNLSLTASISSAAADRPGHGDHGLWGEGTQPETESCDAHDRVNSTFRWLPCLLHSISGAEPGTQDVVDNLRFVARHHLVSRAASTRQQTWKHESAGFRLQCGLKVWDFKLPRSRRNDQ